MFYYLTFKEDKTTEKPTFALHGYGSAPYDPTTYYYCNAPSGCSDKSLHSVSYSAKFSKFFAFTNNLQRKHVGVN